MLLTEYKGGVGLNLQAASVVIFCEAWWNHNTELQAIGRAHRYGQTENVLVIRLRAVDGGYDDKLVEVQAMKHIVNQELMRGIVRRHDQEPVLLPLYTRDFDAILFEQPLAPTQ